MVFLMDLCTQLVAMPGENLLKTTKARWGEDCQFSKRLVIDVVSGMGDVVLPTQTPWVVYSMHRLCPSTRVGMVMHLVWEAQASSVRSHADDEECMGRQ